MSGSDVPHSLPRMRASGRCCWKGRRTQIDSDFGKNVPTIDQCSHREIGPTGEQAGNLRGWEDSNFQPNGYCRDTSEPGLASLIYRRSGRGSCTRCSVFLRADRSSDHFGLSANRAGVLNAQSWRLIIVWLEVRVFPAPPRSPAQTEISQFNANRPAGRHPEKQK